MMRRHSGISYATLENFSVYFSPFAFAFSIWILLTEISYDAECFDAWQMKIDLFLNLFVKFVCLLFKNILKIFLFLGSHFCTNK